ncbi:LytTR family transcriptional regulator DNA-binding domain-containing protein [Clostridium sp. NSJ-6]|uniref:LytTR family transcriptional regulator DNA-binding domain-containing protein n=1 Tax=Clostridium hominis TaxID=2763036 RepID=A0ABR7DGP7_9CLOT|nr:LytTR family DNA-binding domain-containing protein [Clostridium hominis]MBC5630586.1 LytTR family transcriptional regulator DNA-binding domain-containing protein [Clostridium hominis]MDU2672144.1 LytTR family DNA-binding domain-containing protein [Clostridium sp.]
MKITINESEDIEDLEIVVNCKRVDENLLKMIAAIRAFDRKITATRDGKLFVLDVDAIYYFESVDKKTFIYLDKDVYESSLRLYELEEKFVNTDFFRASKSTIINLSKIKVITPIFGGKLEVLLENNEKLVVSRQYVPLLKRKLNF